MNHLACNKQSLCSYHKALHYKLIFLNILIFILNYTLNINFHIYFTVLKLNSRRLFGKRLKNIILLLLGLQHPTEDLELQTGQTPMGNVKYYQPEK